MTRTALALAGLLVAFSPFAAAAPAAALPVAAPTAQVADPADTIVPVQYVVRERYRERGPRWREERRWNRRWDGYTGQVCRSRVIVQVNPFGVRERRVVRTCR
jgi:hypothetical protein